MRYFTLALIILLGATAPLHARKPLIGGPKTIALDANGEVSKQVVKAQMGMGGYLKGAKQIAVPLIAVAFESSAEAAVSNRSTGASMVTTSSKSLKLRLSLDEKVMQSICDELQALVEKDLQAEGFEILPATTIDQEPRWLGIKKDEPTGVEVKDNFMSGFAGNRTRNIWYTAGQRPLFGTGSTGALSELSPLIRTAREKKISLLFYRFKVQFADVDANKGVFFSSIKGENVLHMVSADCAVFTPDHTLGGMLKLQDNITAGADYVQSMKGASGEGNYLIVADPQRYSADALRLIHAMSKQFAHALRAAQ
ncbi:MAG: hypothetical protein ABIV50_07085 [Opitutus sp.]